MKTKTKLNKVAVIFGGKNCEHDISIITAMQTIANIDKTKYEVLPIYIHKNGEWLVSKDMNKIDFFDGNYYKRCKKVMITNNGMLYKNVGCKYVYYANIDFVIVCMHGINGEDGGLMGLLNIYNIPYSCSDITASAIGCDKAIFKYVCKGLDVPVVDCIVITNRQIENYSQGVDYNSVVKKLGGKVIIKPARLGSSIGIRVADNEVDYKSAILYASTFDERVIVERYIPNIIEINVAIIKDKDGNLIVSDIERPVSMEEILTFEEKYLNNGKEGFAGISKIVNPKIKKVISRKIVNYAKKVYSDLDMCGVVRFDFIIEGDIVYLNEVNTIPGSMAYYLFSDKLTFMEQLQCQIDTGNKRNGLKNSKRTTFDTSVLNGVNVGCKK